MNFVETSGKTVKEAIEAGLKQLVCDSADVDIEILEMGTPGLFGMFKKPAKVRLTKKDSAQDFNFGEMTLDGASQKKSQPRKKETKPEPAPAREAKPAPEKKSKPRKKEPRPEPVGEVKSEPAPMEEPAPFTATPESEYSPSAKKAAEFISQITEKMGTPVQLEICETAEQLRVRMSGENMSMLIGRRGETLDSVQYLASLYVNKGREEYLRVSLDTEGYRAKREDTLRKLAVSKASRCRKTGKRVALEPMNPYERRILHSALQNDPDVTTHSEGEEPYRRVIITLK